MKLPNFLVCRAQRSGTTLLWSILQSHPQVYMAPTWAPEPKFFSVDAEFVKGLEYYSDTYFGGVRIDHRAIGEKSITYMDSPIFAGRIRRMLPEAKIVFILRNPVTRAYSHYLYSKRGHRLRPFEKLLFGEAIIAEPSRVEGYITDWLKIMRPFSYLERGLYADKLKPWFDCFPREKIFILFYEELSANPVEAAKPLWDFLDVTRLDKLSIERINGNGDGENVPALERRFLEMFFAAPNRQLERMLRRHVPWTRPAEPIRFVGSINPCL